MPALDDLLGELVDGGRLKGVAQHQHLIQHAPQRPDVSLHGQSALISHFSPTQLYSHTTKPFPMNLSITTIVILSHACPDHGSKCVAANFSFQSFQIAHAAL